MDIGLEELRDSARRVLSKSVDRRAPYSDAPATDGGLRQLMAEQGWMLLTTPSALGGLGQSFVALSPIYEELGRTAARVAFSTTMAAVDVLSEIAGSSVAEDLLSAIGNGNAVVAVAVAKEGELTVKEAGSDVEISGKLRDVLDADRATHLLVLSHIIDMPVIVIDLDGGGIIRSEVATWDRTRSLADCDFDGAQGHVLLSGAAARGAAAVACAHLDLAVASDSLGGADQIFSETIDYMATRVQFGRPVGSFQALKHRSADLKVVLELARAFTVDACDAFATRRAGWASIAAQAKLIATDAFRAIAEEAVQFHGGIGFTWEHDCHLFLKRALLNEMLGGTPEQYKDRVAPDILRRAFAGEALGTAL